MVLKRKFPVRCKIVRDNSLEEVLRFDFLACDITYEQLMIKIKN